VTWRIYVWHDSYICVWHDGFTCDMTHTYVCNMTHLRVTWLIHMCVTWVTHSYICNMTHPYVRHVMHICWGRRGSKSNFFLWDFSCCVSCDIFTHLWHESLICVKWPIHMCDIIKCICRDKRGLTNEWQFCFLELVTYLGAWCTFELPWNMNETHTCDTHIRVMSHTRMRMSQVMSRNWMRMRHDMNEVWAMSHVWMSHMPRRLCGYSKLQWGNRDPAWG